MPDGTQKHYLYLVAIQGNTLGLWLLCLSQQEVGVPNLSGLSVQQMMDISLPDYEFQSQGRYISASTIVAKPGSEPLVWSSVQLKGDMVLVFHEPLPLSTYLELYPVHKKVTVTQPTETQAVGSSSGEE
eukprot:2121281-Lingulodinium_polyedra.AAC.1